VSDIIRDGVVMIVFVFVVVVLYILLSDPFDTMMTSFENLNLSSSDAQVESASGLGRTVFDIAFVGLGIVPLLWFVVRVMRREPDWYWRQ